MLSSKQIQQRQMGGWKEAPGEMPYVSVSLQQWSTCARYCRYCSLTQCASADQKTTSHPLSELLIFSYRASRYFNGWKGFLGNLLWEGPLWPWRLAVASFKNEHESDACISTNYIVTFHGVLPIKHPYVKTTFFLFISWMRTCSITNCLEIEWNFIW